MSASKEKTVKMYNEDAPGNKVADVNEKEVKSYQLGGWVKEKPEGFDERADKVDAAVAELEKMSDGELLKAAGDVQAMSSALTAELAKRG